MFVADRISLQLPYGDPTPLASRGWRGPVGESRDVHNGERISFDLAGAAARYYLIWITTLPPGMEMVTISELLLFK